MQSAPADLTPPQWAVLNAWRAFAILAFGIFASVAIVPALAVALVPHTGWPIFGLIYAFTLAFTRIAMISPDLGFRFARARISSALVVSAILGIGQLAMRWNQSDYGNPWLHCSPLQPLVTVLVPLIWLGIFWLIPVQSTARP